MKISIITATYNSSKYLSGVLNSISQQTHKDIELIVIDGASTDGTVEIVKQSKLASVIISEKDKGIYDALNKGINLATGEIIGFLHSDDIFASPDTLQNIAEAFAENTNISVVYGDLVFVDPFNTDKIVRYWKSRPFKPSLLNRGWMPAHPTVFMRSKIYQQHGLFDISLKCAADYDYILRIFKDPSIEKKYLPEVITKMRTGGISTKGIRNIINKKKEDYQVLRQNKIPFPLWTLICKNVSKLPQLFLRQ